MEDFYGQFIGIAVVLGALAALLWFAKSRGMANWNIRARSSGGLVRVIERVPLTPQHTLIVVELAGRTLLLTASPGSCQLITEQPVSMGDSSLARPAR